MLTSKRKAHLIIVTVFMLGIVVGASSQYLLSYQASPHPTSTVTDVANELTRVLNLDQAQRSHVMQALNDCQQQNQDLKNQTRPQFQAIRENARNRIRSILSDGQQALYNQWTSDLDAKREKRASEEGKKTGK